MPRLWQVSRNERAHWRGSRWPGWELVWQVVDAHACPRCGAFVRGKERYKHEADHEKIDTAVEELCEAIEVMARKLNLPVRRRSDEDLADEDDDERLTRKARQVIGGGEASVDGYVIGNGPMPTVGEYE